MAYTVTDENLNKAVELLALLNCDIREMERKHLENVRNITTYNVKSEKLLDEIVLLSMVLGVDVKEIDELVSKRTHELELKGE